MKSNLKDLFINHAGKLSDKWSLYINEWDEIFSPYQDRVINLLEIGVHNGGSLEIFAKYFLKAEHIIGSDIDQACRHLAFDDPRISIIIGDINSADVEHQITQIVPHLDIIIDDGSHQSRDIIQAFSRYFNKLGPGGLYLIEDLHASYWDDHEGGLHNPYTAISFFKRLVDITNFEHWQSGQSREAYLLPYKQYYDLDFDEFGFLQIHSIKFINSLCLIQKRLPEENTLGKRMIVGVEEAVSKNYRQLDGTTIHEFPNTAIDDVNLDVFALIDRTAELETDLSELKPVLQHLKDTVAEREQSIQVLSTQIDEKEHHIQRITAKIADQELTLSQLETELQERDQFIEKLNTAFTHQHQKILSLEADNQQQDETLQQLENDLAEGRQQIQEFKHRLAALNQQLLEANNEILFYALSKSWRMTRPLRKLMNLLRGRRHV